MKTTLLNTLAVTALLALGLSSASATIMYEDYDGIWTKLYEYGSPSSYSSEFNLLIDGYNPSTQHIVSATAMFELDDFDSDSFYEYIEIDLGSVSSAFGPYEIDFDDEVGGAIGGSILVDLSEDGILNYTVRATQGDLKLRWAHLVAYAEYDNDGPVDPPTNGVPEGGTTLALLGSSLLGMMIARRKIRG